MTSRPDRVARTAQSLAIRSGRGTLRHAWVGFYDLTARAAGSLLTRGEPGAAVYTRSGTGTTDVVPGVSDIDLAIVLPPDKTGAATRRVRDRYARLERTLPPAARLIELPCVYDEQELDTLASASYATFGLETAGEPRAAYAEGPDLLDRRRILERPGLGNAVAGWRRIGGPERRPRIAAQNREARLVAAYLELAFWWRFAFGACQSAASPHVASLCVKLVSEPARIWLWLEGGEQFSSRRHVLERALQRLPEEEAAIRAALDLERRLHEQPEPPLAETLGACVRLSSRVAALITTEAYAAGSQEFDSSAAIRQSSCGNPARRRRRDRVAARRGSGPAVRLARAGHADSRRRVVRRPRSRSGRPECDPRGCGGARRRAVRGAARGRPPAVPDTGARAATASPLRRLPGERARSPSRSQRSGALRRSPRSPAGRPRTPPRGP